MSPAKKSSQAKAKKKDARPAKAKVHPKAKAKAKAKPVRTGKPAKTPAAKEPPPKPAAKVPARPATAKTVTGATPAGAAPAAAKPPAKPAGKAPGKAGKPPKRSGRRGAMLMRGPDGEVLAPGELLLPGGPKGSEETQYLFRGCVAAEHPFVEEGVAEVITKRGQEGERSDLNKLMTTMQKRFEAGSIEVMLPGRGPAKRNFAGVVERAKLRRREIGAFLRGLDLGRTETSHMDSHGEASLQSLMEWAARLENLAEADEPDQADYNQFHRGLDQLESTTEALIIDVELTLRRLRDRTRAH
jgi:hypothetical protein